MFTFRWVASVAMVAMATTNLIGQGLEQFQASSLPETAEDVAQAVYASLSDMEHAAKATKQVAYESLNDAVPSPVAASPTAASAPGTVYLSDFSEGDRGAGIGQVSLLAPSCGLDGCSDPACCDTSCGLPTGGLLSPGYEVPDVGYGLTGLPYAADGGCDTCCETCSEPLPCGALCTRQCPSCCGVGTHFSNVYGELLYLRARNAEVAYAVPTDGPLVAGQPSPIQVGNVGVLDPDYEVGFRAGVNVALDTVSSLDVRYTLFESFTENETSTVAPFSLHSLVTHPSTATASQDGLAALASLEIDFDLIDVSYRHLFKCCELFSANYVIGARYAKLEQQFDSQFLKQGIETVSTDIDFDGGGLRLGLETERYSCRNQLHIYANGYASFMAGRFRASYFQGQAFDPTVVNAEWEAGRIVPILDLEAGVGWSSCDRKLTLSAGYLVSAWFNTVTTQDYVQAIQSNNYLGLGDTMTFDGLQARVQYRF